MCKHVFTLACPYPSLAWKTNGRPFGRPFCFFNKHSSYDCCPSRSARPLPGATLPTNPEIRLKGTGYARLDHNVVNNGTQFLSEPLQVNDTVAYLFGCECIQQAQDNAQQFAEVPTAVLLG